jgi:hypothetical protein
MVLVAALTVVPDLQGSHAVEAHRLASMGLNTVRARDDLNWKQYGSGSPGRTKSRNGPKDSEGSEPRSYIGANLRSFTCVLSALRRLFRRKTISSRLHVANSKDGLVHEVGYRADVRSV